MQFIKLTVLIVIVIAFTFPIYGQDEDPIKVETNLVNINVAITGKKGKFVEGLKTENFEIFDKGIKQEIEYFTAMEAPISFGIVYDMHPTTDERTKAVLESLREFKKTLRPNDDLFTLVFNRRGTLLVDFVPTSEQLKTHLSGRLREPNALYDAIYKATGKIGESRNYKRVLLVITDSADHNSEHRFSDIEEQLKTLDAQVYTILWDEAEEWEFADITRNGQSRNKVSSDATSLTRAALQNLAFRTGGVMQSPTVQNTNELYRIYTQISYEMRRQYTLGFYPETVDGKWHDLRINLRGVKNTKGIAMTYRPGYQSPPAN